MLLRIYMPLPHSSTGHTDAHFQVLASFNQRLSEGRQSNVAGAVAGQIGVGLPPHSTVSSHNFLPALSSLITLAVVDQQAIQGRLQQVQQEAFPVPQGELHCCNSVNVKKKKIIVPWPNNHVFVGQLRRKITYHQLSIEQFSLGFLKIVELET